MKNKIQPMPSLKSDARAEQFVANADLSTFDLSGFKPMRFEVEPKSAALHLRLPESYCKG
jgi:predicted DNA binding CopG/RHH family protein